MGRYVTLYESWCRSKQSLRWYSEECSETFNFLRCRRCSWTSHRVQNSHVMIHLRLHLLRCHIARRSNIPAWKSSRLFGIERALPAHLVIWCVVHGLELKYLVSLVLYCTFDCSVPTFVPYLCLQSLPLALYWACFWNVNFIPLVLHRTKQCALKQ